MNTIRPMLLHELEPHHDVTAWIAQEKMDGFRAVFDCERQQFYSRSGRSFNAPEWFIGMMPDATLDGELWAGRGGLATVQSAVQLGQFERVQFVAYDAPNHFGDYTARLEYVRRVCAGTAIQVVESQIANSYEHARTIAREFFRAGGEGVVVKNPKGIYRQGMRSWDILKFKP